MKIDTAIPPRYRRNPISRHSLVRETKKRRLRFFKAAVFQMGVLIGLLHDGFFSFADGFFSFAIVRQLLSFCIIKFNSRRNLTTNICIDKITG